MNCWEYKRCGKEVTGGSPGEPPCPAATCRAANGIHYGNNGGRACWALDGTLCEGTPQTVNEKILDCSSCAFYLQVHQEETDNLLSQDQIRSLAYSPPASRPLEHT